MMKTIGKGRWAIETVKGIIEHHQYAQVGGTTCDLFTAGAVMQLWEAMNAEQRTKLLALPFPLVVKVTWKVVKP